MTSANENSNPRAYGVSSVYRYLGSVVLTFFFSSHFSFISRFNNEVVVSLYPRGLIYEGTSERVVKVLTGRYGRK